MRYRRVFVPGSSYFLTVVLQDSSSDLLINKINELRSAFREAIERYPFMIDGIVIMPDHFHMIMTLPTADLDYSTRLGFIKSRFSRQIEFCGPVNQSKTQKRERGIWQRRFWEHTLRHEMDYLRHMDYIHYNPVKHGYVKAPAEWKHSSIHRYIKLGILSPEWGAKYECQESLYGE